MREDLITSAISFLSDPKVQSAPLAKKVSFLESKGMTSEEIEEAMARSSGKAPTASAPTAVGALQGPGMHSGPMVMQPPPVPQRPSYDWRDIFIAAVLAGGVGYGVWTLAKRLFGPWFKVPTQKELEEDKEKLDAQFQAVEDSLKGIKDQTNAALDTVSSQSKKVDESILGLEVVLRELKQGDLSREDEFKTIKSDMLDRNKESQGVILNDLQTEVKSLKSLLLSRRPTNGVSSVLEQGSSTPVSPAHLSSSFTEASPVGLSPRLSAALNSNAHSGIPAWQISAAKATSAAEAKPSTTTEETTPVNK
ncbi:peroxisomal membrane anchor protein conserved region-domain-containing protein [Phycomyces nitens]|nr:peroxisomal membrane anchor protein conserved region-domain-containing protein [Phycomyces nitens]